MSNLDIKHMRKGPPTLEDAVEQIAPGLVAHDMRDQTEIGAALASLSQSGEALTVYSSRQDDEPAMARIASVDTERNVFVLDVASGLPGAASRAIFVAAPGGNARLQFELELDWATLPGYPDAIEVPFPTDCRVLNRRAEQRLETPLGGNYGARFAIFGKVYELPLYDFSGGGVGLRATPEQALELYVGKKLEGVELELGSSLVVSADLEIRLMRPFRTFLLGQQVQVGCRISNISMQMRQSLDRAVAQAQRRR